MKGQILSGSFDSILVRQKNNQQIELGELLVAETPDQKILFEVFDLSFGSQISQQNLELLSGMQLETNENVSLYEKELRSYSLAHIKALLTISKTHAKATKALPQFLSTLREVQKKDLSFLTNDRFIIGNLRSGSKVVDLDISLDVHKTLTHHILIPATTGKGKSNLMKVLLYQLIEEPVTTLVFDPHDEYFGRTTRGLKDHPQFKHKGFYYSRNTQAPGAITLQLSLEDVKPHHFSAVEFSTPQEELMHTYYHTYKQEWITKLLNEKDADKFKQDTLHVVQRRLQRLLTGVFVPEKTSMLANIMYQAKKGSCIIIDTSAFSGAQELLISSIITQTLFDEQKKTQFLGEKITPISVVLEEAPRVIGKDVLERQANIFGTIAKEGRKFGMGLCAITQLPSLIPKDILANMNTKIILGIEMAPERNAIIESAAQDLSQNNRTIASLDTGEAIITSNFTKFAIPIKIPKFESLLKPPVPKKLGGIKN